MFAVGRYIRFLDWLKNSSKTFTQLNIPGGKAHSLIIVCCKIIEVVLLYKKILIIVEVV